MQLKDLDFPFPEELIATRPQEASRVMWVGREAGNGSPEELSIERLIARFNAGDLLVINDTKVLKRRVFSLDGVEILFLRQRSERLWDVLMPARKVGRKSVFLPGGRELRIVENGRPQIVELNAPVGEDYFSEHGELPLPPYIQKSRGERKPVAEDENWYQTAWAETPGSLAAPTASLHFQKKHLSMLREKGVGIEVITLHVGLGTFLPISVEDLTEHRMHSENVSVSASAWRRVNDVQGRGGKIWALGTTVTRTLESCALGLLSADGEGNLSGATDLFIRPGFRFQAVDRLLTNFHQPKTTLLALVMAFAGEDRVKNAYRWAIERRFRLFSYGDLTVWS